MSATIIVAYNAHGLIGTKQNTIPWRIAEDMKHFKESTTGHVCIMGRKTWDSIPPKFRPLPDRENIIITRNPGPFLQGALPENVHVSTDVKMAIIWARTQWEDKTIFVTGGAEIYKAALESGLVTRMLVSEVKGNDCQEGIFFPPRLGNWEQKLLRNYEQFNLFEYTKTK